MSIELKKDFYGVKIPAKATVYGVNVFRVDIMADGKNISSHRYDAEISLKFFSEKTGEHIKNEDATLKVEGVSQELVNIVLPAVYGVALGAMGGQSDEEETTPEAEATDEEAPADEETPAEETA